MYGNENNKGTTINKGIRKSVKFLITGNMFSTGLTKDNNTRPQTTQIRILNHHSDEYLLTYSSWDCIVTESYLNIFLIIKILFCR